MEGDMVILNKKGNVLLYVIIAMTMISLLGTGAYFMTSTSTFSGLSMNNLNKAYSLATGGKDYALMKNLGDTAGRTFTIKKLDGTLGDKFLLEINGDKIKSTGIVNEGTPYEARRMIEVTKSGFASKADISFARDMAAMTPIQVGGTDLISKTDTYISLGKIGADYQSKFGAVIYGGSATEGGCVAGKCKFGEGIRAFFTFQFASGSAGDGITFTLFNGDQNDAGSVGGYAGSGELMGYAGDSYVSAGYYLDGEGGRGIQPPKVAVEFDPYANPGTGSICSSNSRNDGSSKNHMALMFWGNNTTSCGSTVGKYTFDDNRHGSGSGSNEEPTNGLRVAAGGDACSYFNGDTLCGGGSLSWPDNWLLNWPSNAFAFRMEVTRKLTPEASGNYQYRFKVWIKRCASGDPTCSADYSDTADYVNTKKDYTADNPTLDRTIEISPTYHQRFDTMLFGWTLATGGATQSVPIYRFRMNFKK